VERFVQVYQNPRRIPSGVQTLSMPIIDRMLINEPNAFAPEGGPLPDAPMRTLELKKCNFTFHVSYDLLEDCLNVNLQRDLQDLQSVCVFLGDVATSANAALETIQPLAGGHPVIIDRVDLGQQDTRYQIVIEIKFWAVTLEEADVGRAVFERIFHESLSNGGTRGLGERATRTGNSPLPYLDPSTFHRKGYDTDAEENAHELLKKMLTKKQFELYKLEGYVAVKGTYGRTYRVNKNDMIDVVKNKKGSKAKSYRLCIEPRDNGTICPTDEVIAKIKLIQSSEKELHKVGIKWAGNINVTITGGVSTAGYCIINEMVEDNQYRT